MTESREGPFKLSKISGLKWSARLPFPSPLGDLPPRLFSTTVDDKKKTPVKTKPAGQKPTVVANQANQPLRGVSFRGRLSAFTFGALLAGTVSFWLLQHEVQEALKTLRSAVSDVARRQAVIERRLTQVEENQSTSWFFLPKFSVKKIAAWPCVVIVVRLLCCVRV